MRIHRLTIRNLNSLRLHTAIDFSAPPLANTGLFAITGDTGAGKSTILDAITLALYGKVPRNPDNTKDVLSYGAIDCLAEVEFEHGGKKYLSRWSIYRSRKKLDGNIIGPVRELEVWDPVQEKYTGIAKGVKDTDQALEEITGLDYDRFRRSVLLAQGDFAAFLDAEEKQRSELLERITGTEIYTEISKAAFRRWKEEEEKLGAMRQQLNALRLLSEEELEALRQNLNSLQETAQASLTDVEAIREKIAHAEALVRARHNLEQFRRQEIQLQEMRAARQDEQEKLRLHELASPYQAELTALEEQGQSLVQDQNWLENARQQLQILEAEALRQQNLRQELNIALTTAKNDLQTRIPVWKKARELDLQLRERAAPLEQCLQEKETLAEEQTLHLQQIQQLTAELENLFREIESAKNWLNAHQAWKSLGADFPLLERERQTYDDLHNRAEYAKVELETLENQYAEYSQAFEAADSNAQQAAAQLLDLETRFLTLIPERYPRNRADLLDHLFREAEALSREERTLEDFERIDREYRQILRTRSVARELLEQLKAEDQAINKDLFSIVEYMELLAAELQERQEILEQQQKIANYEQDRASLEPGQPCPLCFSTDHPFRHASVKPFIDRARQDLEKTRKAFADAGQKQRELLDRHRETGRRIQEVTERLNDMQAMSEYETQIAGMLKLDPDFSMGPSSFKERRKSIHRKLEEIHKTREELVVLNKSIGKAEDRVRSLQEIRQEKLLLRDTTFERLEGSRKAYAAISKDLELRVQVLTEKLQQLGQKFSLDRIDAVFLTLAQHWEAYQSREQALKQYLEQETITRLALEHEEKQRSGREARLKTVLEASVQLQRDFNALQQARRQLLGDADPEIEEHSLRDQIERQFEILEQTGKELNQLMLQKKEQEGAINQRQKAVSQLQKSVSQLSAKLKEKAATLGFPDIGVFRGALLTEEEVRRIRAQEQQFKEQEAELRALLREAEQTLQALESKSETSEELDVLQQSRADKEAVLNGLLEQIGSYKHQLEQQDKIFAEVVELRDSLHAQEQEIRRWSALNELIGAYDGKKFRIYAQGLTLAQLVVRANGHLSRLSGRYIIRKKEDEDLELDIIDTYQADNTRSMKTLSGGERFLVSLALALGLADLAGGKTNIQSLFIDEGFGTLDDNSLDVALSTLENLQSSGKTIGIISHVKELKERIGVQIQLHKQSNGFSEIRIVEG